MGYDQTRFLSHVDDEFICVICSSVVENPVQTPCEHLFCKKCIKDWLNINETCPVDKRSLTTNDLNVPYRILRNLLNKLNIKCDFEQDGCKTITQLEHLQQHVSKCVHNLDAVIVCDKGCNKTITRREHHEHSCVFHLAKENTKLQRELNEQTSLFERSFDSQATENRKLRHELSLSERTLEIQLTKLRQELSEKKCHFEQTLDSQAKENTKLRHELSEQKCHFEETLDSQAKENLKLRLELFEQKCHFEQKLDSKAQENNERLENCNSNREKGEIAKLCADISLNDPPKWQQMYNMNISPENVLEKKKVGYAFVQSAQALNPTKYCFEIHVTISANYEYFRIGLTRRGYFRGLDLVNILSAFSNDSGDNFLYSPLCKNGDVIECGIEFPNDFIDDDKHSAQLYVSVNQKLKFKETRVIPKNGFFPTMLCESFSSAKIRYCQK